MQPKNYRALSMFLSMVNDILVSQWKGSKFSSVGVCFPSVEMVVLFAKAPVGYCIGLLSLLNV